jgi:methylmalonyl-CoA/ethylmalonyl-CoA epimerase
MPRRNRRWTIVLPAPSSDVPDHRAPSFPSRIGQIAIPVADLDRAVQFYGEILGLRLLFRAPPALAFFDCGGVRLMLSPPEGEAAPRQAGVVYYVVEDLDTTYRSLVARGVSFLDGPHCVARLPDHELWMAFCRDSEENLLALMSEVRPEAAARSD